MAATITYGTTDRINTNKIEVIGSLAADTSYPTGGYAVTPGQFGLSRIDSILGLSSAGYISEYIPSTGKIMIYTPGAAGSATFTGAALAGHQHNAVTTVDEVVAVAAHTGTLAAAPGVIQSVTATAAAATGGKRMVDTGTAPAAGEVAVTQATGVLVFNAADNVTSAKVTYMPATNAVSSVSAGTPAGTVAVAAAAGGEVANGTNLSAIITAMKLIVIGA